MTAGTPEAGRRVARRVAAAAVPASEPVRAAGRVHRPTTAGRCSSRRCGSGRHPRVPVHRRAGRRLGAARRRRRPAPAGRRCAAPAGSALSAPSARAPYLLVADLGPAGPVPPHAAGGQADLADERGHLDPGRLRPGRRAGRGRRAAPRLGCARPGWAAWRRRPARPAGLWAAPRPRAWPPTPRCCWPRRPCRPGTRRTRSCRSSSPAPRRQRRPARPAGRAARQAGPARRLAVIGSAAELAASQLIERRPGLVTQAWTTGRAHRLRRGRRSSRWAGRSPPRPWPRPQPGRRRRGGLALLGGSVLQRFGIFEAGVASTKDPKYVVVPQRERLNARA